MSKGIFEEEINWAQVIPEIEKHIAKPDAEFEREWEARVGARTSSRISQKWTSASGETSTAQAALDKLVRLGCERERILGRLYQYVGGEPEKVSAVKKAFGWQRDHMLNTSDALIKTANDVEQDFANLAFVGIHESNSPEEDMRSCSESLKRWANTVFKDLASQRVSARDHHLGELAKMIEKVTGAPHYSEIATLVDRVGLAYDPEFTKVTRRKKTDDEATDAEKADAETADAETADAETTYEATTADAIRGRIRRYGQFAALFG
jgi:hypothetical protein